MIPFTVQCEWPVRLSKRITMSSDERQYPTPGLVHNSPCHRCRSLRNLIADTDAAHNLLSPGRDGLYPMVHTF